jgi:hypothetical protein
MPGTLGAENASRRRKVDLSHGGSVLIVTGCGRGGTKFAAELFGCVHEETKPPEKIWFRSRMEPTDDEVKSWVKLVFTGNERDSNHYIADCAYWIQELLPEATMIHLVRDPKSVVRSLMSQSAFDHPERHRYPVDNWDEISKFERCCWYWKITNERLRKLGLPRLRLEDLRGTPKNETPEHQYPEWREWTLEEKSQFNKILGGEATLYGYARIALGPGLP